jgi:hypothetical protein
VGGKPQDGSLTIYGVVERAFLSGKADVQLSTDYNPRKDTPCPRSVSAHS